MNKPLNSQLKIDDQRLADAMARVCRLVRRAGGNAYLVGGCVRDHILRRRLKDIDVEVFGIEAERLQELLAAEFRLDEVGQAYGILKVHGLDLDIGLPRRESKAGLGHRGFLVNSDPWMPIADAAARRDFTINAIYLDPLSDRIEDPWGGLADLARSRLRHTSAAFAEDPLRVLRGMQFAARFDLIADEATVALCRQIEPEGLAPERIFAEWRKLILLGEVPSRGLAFLRDSGWLQYFPELAALIDCPQDPEWHPEGDVWIHTLHAMDAFAREKIGDDWEDLVVGFAVLCHDFGKPETTTQDQPDQESAGHIRAIGHETAGEEPTRRFLARLTDQRELGRQVVPLVVDHIKPQQLHAASASDAAIRRLARRVCRIDRLVRVARADVFGRPPLSAAEFAAGDWLLAQAERLAVAECAPQPLVLGRHLIQLGVKPGPNFGPILAACYDAQIEGSITSLEEGLALARQLIADKAPRPETDDLS